jgi:2-methylfumaryl-CoA isomerase
MFQHTADNPSGFAYPAAGAFATFPGMERRTPAPAPVLGADTRDVLARHLALDPQAIDRLLEAGIAGTPA